MINIRSIKKLADGDGLTLKKGKVIRYKTGWQVADYGIETACPRDAINAVKAYNGNCGVWFENGVYYVDHSFRITTKKEAMKVAKQFNQISIYGWARGNLAYTKDA